MAQWVSQVYLRHFRNYKELHLALNPGMHFLLGPNGVGKTNFLEAVHFLGTGQATRSGRVRDLIHFGANQAYLKALVSMQAQEVTIEWIIDRKLGRAAKINGQPVRRQQEIAQLMPVVYFSPDHIHLLKGSPGERRRHLDDFLRQLFPSYGYDLLRYQHALKQRNEALRLVAVNKANIDYLEYWEQPLIQHGLKIIERRKQMVEQMSSLLHEAHQQIADKDVPLGFSLQQPYTRGGQEIVDEQGWQEAKQHHLKEEIRRGHTLIGPHRDDYLFTLSSKDARHYASQGQQRSIVLALLLAELRLIEDLRRQQALLLLDDVFSELDEQRRLRLMHLLSPEQQTFLTATDWSAISLDQPPEGAKVYYVEQGKIRLG